MILNDAWHVSLYARNVFNERSISSASNRNGTDQPAAYFIQPATYAFIVSRSF